MACCREKDGRELVHWFVLSFGDDVENGNDLDMERTWIWCTSFGLLYVFW